jgi:hypothetical protein
MIAPHTLKGLGYLVSTLSVILLAIVSWQSASRAPLLTLCLLSGAATSIIGMGLRWTSYEYEKRREARGKQGRGNGSPQERRR